MSDREAELLEAIADSDQGTVRELLKSKGEDLANAWTAEGSPAIHEAVRVGQASIASLLAHHKAVPGPSPKALPAFFPRRAVLRS